MKNLRYAYFTLIILGVTACAAPTLEEKLAGKTGDERMKTLYHDCIQRANYEIPGGHSKEYIGHEGRLWKICDLMYEASKQQTSSETSVFLAKECSAEINRGLIADNEANVRHFQRVQKICQEMNGKPVVLNISVQ